MSFLQAEVTQRLTNTKEATGRVGALESHEDLAKKLKVKADFYSVCCVSCRFYFILTNSIVGFS